MPDPLEELEDFDWQGFADQAEIHGGDIGRRLAENVMRNVTEAVRQPRNELEHMADQRKTLPEITDATDLTIAPQRERSLEASHKAHFKELFRLTGEALAKKLKSQQFMGFKPGQPGVVLSLKEYNERDLATLGTHPHSDEIAVPIPKGYESAARLAAKLSHLSPKLQARWLVEYTAARAQGRPPPPPPAE